MNYVWDRQNVLIEANASNAIQAVHTLEPALYGNQVSQRRSGVTSYLSLRRVGSTLQLTGAAGTATDSYLYRAFGDLVTSSGTTVNAYQYVGRKGYIYDSDLFNHQVRCGVTLPEWTVGGVGIPSDLREGTRTCIGMFGTVHWVQLIPQDSPTSN